MAEVMQSSSTITMLHSRPSSADAFNGSQQQYSQTSRLGPAPRGTYTGQNTIYRGMSTPVQPYAFSSTPHLRQDSRTSSTHSLPQSQRVGHQATASASTSSSDASVQPPTREDSALASRPVSTFSLPPQLPDLSFNTSFEPPVKASPDRYRRPAQKRVDSISNSPASILTSPPRPTSASNETRSVSTTQPQQVQRQPGIEDLNVARASQTELAKRYRRRSLNQLETQELNNDAALPSEQRPSSSGGSRATSTPTTIRPVAAVIDEPSKAVDPRTSAPTAPRAEQKLSVPPRGSSDNVKRLAAPSPLSRQASDGESLPASVTASPTKPRTYAAAAQSQMAAPSPAAAQLAAITDKDLNKGMKSRLRRAFSFGSAQELRRAAGENHQAATQHAMQARGNQQQQIDDEMDAEQLEIARRQEAAGIGAGIYSGQGGFTGSTDNLSISSTASSASMMLRKMGRGAKKSARSVKGLFRTKSVIGVPAADGPIQVGSSAPVEPSIAQVSRVTVEAERQKVNVNARPDEKTGGGTGFPKLERNSVDVAQASAGPEARGSADGSDSHSRRSIVGSDKDRAEVLAAVKKGILKRSGTGSPSGSPVIRPNEAGLLPVTNFVESPQSSKPSTPKDEPQGRSSSAPTHNKGDYFGAKIVAKSMPNTPNGSMRNISFSPRIQFHDAWSASDYDRRGEIATCNRLTPMLAQQIKEELNTFKMEMEVHELSKPHTHFF